MDRLLTRTMEDIRVAGGIDIHSHIAGVNVNTARLLMPEQHRAAQRVAHGRQPVLREVGRAIRIAVDGAHRLQHVDEDGEEHDQHGDEPDPAATDLGLDRIDPFDAVARLTQLIAQRVELQADLLGITHRGQGQGN